MEHTTGSREMQPNSRENHTRQLAQLVDIQTIHALMLSDSGIATKAFWELTPGGREYLDGALLISHAVYTGLHSGYAGYPYRQDFGVEFTYTKPYRDGRIITAAIYSKVGESFGDDQLVVAHGNFSHDEAMAVHGMVMSLKLERDMGNLPDLNETYTGISYYE